MNLPRVRLEADLDSNGFVTIEWWEENDAAWTHVVVPQSAVQTRPCPNEVCEQTIPGFNRPHGCPTCGDGSGQVPSHVFYCEDDEWLRVEFVKRFAAFAGLTAAHVLAKGDIIDPEKAFEYADEWLRLLRGEGA